MSRFGELSLARTTNYVCKPVKERIIVTCSWRFRLLVGVTRALPLDVRMRSQRASSEVVAPSGKEVAPYLHYSRARAAGMSTVPQFLVSHCTTGHEIGQLQRIALASVQTSNLRVSYHLPLHIVRSLDEKFTTPYPTLRQPSPQAHQPQRQAAQQSSSRQHPSLRVLQSVHLYGLRSQFSVLRWLL